MTKLSVNVNKIATLRNTRSLGIPSITKLSEIALQAGAAGITVHPRPDERHIRAADVDEVADVVAAHAEAELNIEGNPFHNLIEHCRRVRPAQATLVPDATDAFTSNQGWNLTGMSETDLHALQAAIDQLEFIGCRVSLFLDPLVSHMKIAKRMRANRIELYTEPYAAAFAAGRAKASLDLYATAAAAARDEGLGVNAGHDLNLDNLGLFVNAVGPVDEVSIGHALIADALELGLSETVRRYKAACSG
ncbi:MAG TPA: pyridoxine 5'-phosphate synthase [Tepidisphaeraceae bacterium]